MKQGQASRSGSASTKVEPVSRGVNPAAVAQIGIKQGAHVDGRDITPKSTPMYEGRGLKAPMANCSIHKGGSQGKHR